MSAQPWHQDQRYEDVPGELARALDTVLADLQLPQPVDLQAGYDSDTKTLWVSERGANADYLSGYEQRSERGGALIADLANWLQEQVMPETTGAWAEARPRCPGHAHPALACADADGAWWVCPTNNRRLARIGEWTDDAELDKPRV
jgi:hypothetical protein